MFRCIRFKILPILIGFANKGALAAANSIQQCVENGLGKKVFPKTLVQKLATQLGISFEIKVNDQFLPRRGCIGLGAPSSAPVVGEWVIAYPLGASAFPSARDSLAAQNTNGCRHFLQQASQRLTPRCTESSRSTSAALPAWATVVLISSW